MSWLCPLRATFAITGRKRPGMLHPGGRNGSLDVLASCGSTALGSFSLPIPHSLGGQRWRAGESETGRDSKAASQRTWKWHHHLRTTGPRGQADQRPLAGSPALGGNRAPGHKDGGTGSVAIPHRLRTGSGLPVSCLTGRAVPASLPSTASTLSEGAHAESPMCDR